jgi:hypothetical protein
MASSVEPCSLRRSSAHRRYQAHRQFRRLEAILSFVNILKSIFMTAGRARHRSGRHIAERTYPLHLYGLYISELGRHAYRMQAHLGVHSMHSTVSTPATHQMNDQPDWTTRTDANPLYFLSYRHHTWKRSPCRYR